MRISDNRYSRDRLRLDLALRLIKHEARTHTIRAWTGLTDDRIRKLYRSYLHEKSEDAVPRHRGKSPQQPGFFTRTPRLQLESAVLASYCTLLGVVPGKFLPDGGRTLLGVIRGMLLCHAFESYRRVMQSPQITFEHAAYLVTSIMRGEPLRMTTCCECRGLLVVDRLRLHDALCKYCVRSDPSCMTPDERASLSDLAAAHP